MTQRRDLSADDLKRLMDAKASADASEAAYRSLVLELGRTVGVRAVCRALNLSTRVYNDWKKAAEA